LRVDFGVGIQMHLLAGNDPIIVIIAYVGIVIFGVLLNLALAKLAEFFGTIVFLDAAGTAAAALICGPWIGALVGLLTSGVNALVLFRGYGWFFYVSAACGFLWGLASPHFWRLLSGHSEIGITLFVLEAGVITGLVTGILSTPLRVFFLRFSSDHLLDNIGKQIAPNERRGFMDFVKVLFEELLLSHILDKLISTTIGIMIALEWLNLVEHFQNKPLTELGSLYHDLVEFFAAYYYVALAVVVRALRISVVHAPANNPTPLGPHQEVFVLLGPLGIFALLLGLPVFLRVIAAILLKLAGG
jgi:energy-coupling factor transport system substrate-specific component